MRKLFLLLISIPSLLYCQPNFWSHHSLDFKITNLFKSRSEIFYANNYDTLLKSSDYGTTWEVIYQGPTRISRIYFNKNFLAEDKIIIKGNSYSMDVMISIDSGQDWNILNLPSGVSGLYADYAIDVDGDLYTLYDTLYFSSNNGEVWNEVNAPQIPSYPTWTSASYKGILIDSLGSFYVSIEWAAYIPSYGYIFGDIIYRSEDGGENWIEILASYSPSYYGGLSSIFIIREKDIFAYDLGLRVNYHYYDDFINGYSDPTPIL